MSFEMQPVSDGQKKILMGLGLVVVIVLVHLFVVEPMKEKTATAIARSKELNAETDRRINMVKKILPMRKEIASLSASILPVTNRYVLHKELGSYPVQRKIYELAPATLKVVRFTERGRVRPVDSVFSKVMASLPRAAASKAVAPVPYYDRYQCELAVQGGYKDLMGFISKLEEENPLFSVLSLEILGNGATPETHDALMSLEWLVDAPPPPPVKGKK